MSDLLPWIGLFLATVALGVAIAALCILYKTFKIVAADHARAQRPKVTTRDWRE